ncbi:MAG: HEAT repeat domain-containing protein [Planctomycetes bacterium]|nr:HEAT repeat domain-containing protein [Planctomycetota bacterium]
MTHRTPARSLLLAATLLLAPASALLAQGQDPEVVFLEGKHAFRNGDHETALAKFREVVQLDPSYADAYRMLASSQDFLAQLMSEGGEFETFALEVLQASRDARDGMRRDGDAAAELAQAALTGSYAERSRAIFEGSQIHGPFFAPPLVAALVDSDEDVRLNAYYALSRMGVDSLLPVLAASHSTNVEVRRGCVQVLLESGDPRADARLADMAANDEDGTVRALASAYGGGDAASLHFKQGWACYVGDPHMGVTELENQGVLWNIDGTELIAFDVHPARVPLVLARHHFGRAAELGLDSGAALALAHAADAAVLGAIGDMDDEQQAQLVAALRLGPAALDGALGLALQRQDVHASAVLADLLTGPSAGTSNNLRAALGSDAPNVRHAAAVALAMSGDSSAAVVAQLGAGMQLEAVRVVHIIDADAGRAAGLAAALDGMGIVAVVSGDGVGGMVNASRGLAADAFVIGDPLPDYYARRLVKLMRRNARYEDTPMLVIDSGDTGDVDDAEVVESVDAAAVVDAFGDLDAERQSYLVAATAAAEAMAFLAASNPVAASAGAGAMAAAVGREDSVAIPAMTALGHAGDGAAAPALLGVVADDGRSSEARAAGARALAGIFSRNPGAGSGARETLKAAMGEGDPMLARACAGALGYLGGSTPE